MKSEPEFWIPIPDAGSESKLEIQIPNLIPESKVYILNFGSESKLQIQIAN